jgi:hypothetical protein
MGDIIIAGVPASLVIVSLVQVAKTLGMPRRFAPLLSIALGVVLVLCVQVARQWPFLRAWWEALGAGIMLGLAACGFYSGGKAMITSHASGKRLKETDAGDVIETTARPAVKALPPPSQAGSGSSSPGDGQ